MNISYFVLGLQVLHIALLQSLCHVLVLLCWAAGPHLFKVYLALSSFLCFTSYISSPEKHYRTHIGHKVLYLSKNLGAKMINCGHPFSNWFLLLVDLCLLLFSFSCSSAYVRSDQNTTLTTSKRTILAVDLIPYRTVGKCEKTKWYYSVTIARFYVKYHAENGLQAFPHFAIAIKPRQKNSRTLLSKPDLRPWKCH